MAEYLTNTADLTAVADAIRAKGGTSAQLVYPTGFVSAIQTIQTGVTPQLIVTTTAGATVTATKGSKTVSGTAGTDGTCTLVLAEAGEWSVTAALGANSRTQTVLIGTQTTNLILLKDSFAENSWDAIIAACQSGSVPSTWAVGDSKTMTINATDYKIDIIGKNHDDYSDKSGKAPLTFQIHDCYNTIYSMNGSSTNSGGWRDCVMRNNRLPDILTRMPTEVQNGIREVNKKASVGSQSSTIEIVSDKLFLLSEIEVFGSVTVSAAGEGTQYAYYAAGGSKVKNVSGSSRAWWERSPATDYNGSFCTVTSSGTANSFVAADRYGVAFAFCF